MSRTSRTPELEEAVENLYKSGLSVSKTAQELKKQGINISPSLVRTIANDRGILRPRGRQLGDTRIDPDKTTESLSKHTVESDQESNPIYQAIVLLSDKLTSLNNSITARLDSCEVAIESLTKHNQELREMLDSSSKQDDDYESLDDDPIVDDDDGLGMDIVDLEHARDDIRLMSEMLEDRFED